MNPKVEQQPVEITREVVDALRPKIRGAVFAPGEPGYDESRALWNAMNDRRPALVVRCLGVADVVAGVQFARAHGLPVSVKGGGHNIAGLAACDGGLMLDMAWMRGVWVDPRAKIARAQAGCLLGDVDRETQLHGLATALGFVSNTGIAGLTLGGGFGYLSKRFGWTSDNVLAMELVTADGRMLRASEAENSSLFWGLRGGGGNFGVVTGFEYLLHPLPPEVTAGVIAWHGDQVDDVLATFRRVATEAPHELAVIAMLRLAPPAPWIAKEAHGKPMVGLAICHTGTAADAERVMAEVRRIPNPVGDIVQRRTYVSQQSLLDATQPKGRRYYWKSEYLPGIETGLLEKMVVHWRTIRSPHSAIILFPLGGAIATLPNDHSAVGNRDAQWLVNVTAAWDPPQEDAANIEWARTAWQDMRGHSTGGTYVNFLNAEETGDRIKDAYGANYDRLVELKTVWDPTNLFRSNKNLAPRP